MYGDRIIYRRRTEGLLATSGNTESARPIAEPLFEGLVVDVILDHNHPDYAPDGSNVGAIKVRIFSLNHGLSDEQLPWADPVDFTIQEMPLIGEVVALQKILGNFFYARKIPIARRIQENGMLNLNKALNQRSTNTISNSINQEQEKTAEKHKFGEYFKPNEKIRPLKHFEGDVIFQGRMGQSIRFGSSAIDPSSKELAPNIILRTGQGEGNEKSYVTKDTIYGLTLEDINKDASSIWMTSNQNLPLLPATVTAGGFGRTMSNPPLIFGKAQILINSDRVMLNAKKESIFLYAKDTIYLNAGNELRIDTDNNFEIATKEGLSFRTSGTIRSRADNNFILNAAVDILSMSQGKTSLLAEKIYIGSTDLEGVPDNEKEPLVGGQMLAKFLRDFINAHLKPPFHVQTPTGPGTLHPKVRTELQKVLKRLNGMLDAEFNSEDNFVMLKNEEVQVEKNDFTAG